MAGFPLAEFCTEGICSIQALFVTSVSPPPAPWGSGVVVRQAQPGWRGRAPSPVRRPLPADVPRGVGFIPTRGARGPGDNFSLSHFSRPRPLASRGDGASTQLVVASQGTAGSVLRPQCAGGGLLPWWGTLQPGWGAWGCCPPPWVLHPGVQGEALGCRFSWSPGHLIHSRRADSSPEPACERMYGNPIATVVPKLCKVHIVLRLPRCSSRRGFLFQGSWKLLAIHPGWCSRLLPSCPAGTPLRSGW